MAKNNIHLETEIKKGKNNFMNTVSELDDTIKEKDIRIEVTTDKEVQN